MSFGAAILQTPRPHRAAPRGRKPAEYDCGQEGLLTMAEMCRITGVTKQTMRYRLQQGWQGKRLLSKAFTRAKPTRIRPALTIAAKLAAHYPRSVPNDKEMRQLHPMSRAAAWSWRNAWRIALEAA